MNKVFAYMNRCSLAAVTVTCLGASPMPAADMMSMEGVEPWEICALCHGATGVTTMSRFPHLAGQKPGYLRRQLQQFRSGERSNDGGQMVPTAEAVSLQEIEDIVNYFSSLPAPLPPTASSTGNATIARGEQIFMKGRGEVPACTSCHAQASSTAPWLFGQHAGYLVKQLHDFATGAREGGVGQVMEGVAASLTESEIVAVAAYVETVPECAGNLSTVVQKTRKNKVKTTCYDRQ